MFNGMDSYAEVHKSMSTNFENNDKVEYGFVSSNIITEKIFDEDLILRETRENIDFLNSILREKNTSVSNELVNLIQSYEEKISFLNDNLEKEKEDIENLTNLIESLKESLLNHINYENLQNTGNTNPTDILPDAIIINPGVSIINDITDAALLEVHALIVSYFSSNGYILAAELLQHMRVNKSVNSSYRPNNTNVIKYTSFYANMVNSKNTSGSIVFEKEGTAASNDAFYAIHGANYNKTYSNTGIVISDRYDYAFDPSYDDVKTDAAVNAMYTAQQRGLLTPYYVIMEYSENYQPTTYTDSFTFTNYTRHEEKYSVLGMNDTLEYNISVSLGGNKTIQTFGPNDTYLYLYDDNNNLIKSNDDGGYKLNAMINYNFEAGKNYVLKVKFYSTAYVGNIRVAFSSIVNEAYDGIPKIIKRIGIFKIYYENIAIDAQANLCKAFTFENNEGKSFTIETIKNGSSYFDTYLYLIDPRRSNYYDGNGSAPGDYFPLFISNDDAGGNLQAKLEVKTSFYAKETPYLLISSLYNLNNSGKYSIKISGLDESRLIIL